MLGLKCKRDGFRLIFPKEFICPEIEQKYTNVLKERHGFIDTPIDLVNETIQKVQVLGFNNATFQQDQPVRGWNPMITDTSKRIAANEFMSPATEYNYRSQMSPIALTDKTINIEFRHILGYLNYFLIFENFWYQYARDTKYQSLLHQINVDIMNEIGEIYSRIILYDPIINGMDMLDLDYTQPVAQSSTFRVEFKYSNLEFEFIDIHNKEQ